MTRDIRQRCNCPNYSDGIRTMAGSQLPTQITWMVKKEVAQDENARRRITRRTPIRGRERDLSLDE